MKVTALTSGRLCPSSRFRVRQFIKPLASLGIEVLEYPLRLPKYTPSFSLPLDWLGDAAKIVARLPGILASKRSDITWLERELVARKYTLEKQAGTKRVFDVDDAIWLTSNDAFTERIVRYSNAVIAGNSYIANYYRGAGANVWIIPTSVDTDRWQPRCPSHDDTWIVGWIGTSSNLPYLYSIEKPLAAFLHDHAETKLHVVCDARPKFRWIPSDSSRFFRWSARSEVGLVQRMNVGIMPLPETDWARGKCACKMLLYMAVGIPVVVSPVGQSADILNESQLGHQAIEQMDWYTSLRRLFFDREEASILGKAGRQLVEDRYSVRSNVIKLADIFRAVALS